MRLDRSRLYENFTDQDLQRGRRYYQDGLVGALSVLGRDDFQVVTTHVRGTELYTVSLFFRSGFLSGTCTCRRFQEGYYCKHMAAAMFKYLDSVEDRQEIGNRKTDGSASKLLRHYLEQESQPDLLQQPVHLEPLIAFDEMGDYPSFRFRIGNEKMYLVKNIQELAEHVARQETASYGKALSLHHTMDRFTPQSRQLLRLLLDAFPQYRSNHYSGWYSGEGSPLGSDKRWIRFNGARFDEVFSLLCGQQVEREDGAAPYRFTDGNPQLHACLTPQDRGAVLQFQTRERMDFFGDPFHLYVVTERDVFRCGEDFSKTVQPFLNGLYREMFFSREDLPALSDCLQSVPPEFLEVEDPEGLLKAFVPDPCTGCCYLDYEEQDGLVALLKFRYAEKLLQAGAPASEYGTIHRNARQERNICRAMEALFPEHRQSHRYVIPEEDKALEFLCDRLPRLQELGEVYLSDRLQAKQVSVRAQPTVGISVSEGILTLDLDLAEFPPEELEALYESLLKRKHYHKLRDGRYLPLTGSGYEKLAEAAHMTQLREKDLRSGHVELPAYRSLYLSTVLENSEGVKVEKNAGFRQLIRNFRSVENSDEPIPETLHATLRPYQETGFRWMKMLEANGFSGILADEMGLGKTVQMLAFLLTVPRSKTGKPSMIVCPASLVINWADELERFAPDLQALVILGGVKERRQQLQQDGGADVYITSYDLLKRDLELYQEKEFYCCILDEGQAIKNQSTQASKAVKLIRCRQRFVLTGTPIENRLSELWNLFDFLMPGYLFSHNAFVQKLEKPIVKSGNPDAGRQLNLLVQPFLLRRRKQEVLKELPPKIFHTYRIALGEQERRTYQAEAHHALAAAAAMQDRVQILALLTRLRQICCDPALCFENYQGESSKLEACLELCASQVANGHQILLFSQFTTMLDRIRERLEAAGISSFTLVGATPKEKRAGLVREFNEGKAAVFLISLKAGGTGLNLTAADVVIHYDPWWNQAAQDQATDRAHRIGQQNTVQVYKLIAKDTLEEKILKLQEKKAALLDAVTEHSESEPMTRAEILSLLE